MKTLIRCTALGLVALALPVLAQQPSAAERAAMLKATLAASQAVLKQYEWVETTVISLKGEEKSRQLHRCYYGADGGVQKVPLTTPPPVKQKRGLRGKIAEAKQEELTDYMKEAVALVKSYVPPTPVLIESAKQGGRVSLDVLEPGRRARLNFRDYLKPGDSLGVEVDLTSNRLLALTVKTHLDSAKDAVDLQARMGTLADGTSYADAITLNAPAKHLTVKVDHSGYRKTN
ncbi:MAG: hypothetical protein KIS67_20675 [Verrucomicrobiae bacterium]|nr:hypothetical protein [Verrucomicrobiae bacterium]